METEQNIKKLDTIEKYNHQAKHLLRLASDMDAVMDESLQSEINAYVVKLQEAARKGSAGEHHEDCERQLASEDQSIGNSECKELTLSPSDRIALDAQANRHKRQLRILSHAIKLFLNQHPNDSNMLLPKMGVR